MHAAYQALWGVVRLDGEELYLCCPLPGPLSPSPGNER